MRVMDEIPVNANVAKELYEIASDFANPIEVVREALHNAYDAEASEVSIIAAPDTLPDGRRVLTLTFTDDGHGMDRGRLTNFFSLGFSDKAAMKDRSAIGFKGHGTKIYYQAQDLLVGTRRENDEPLFAVLRDARSTVYQRKLPKPSLTIGDEAISIAKEHDLNVPPTNGTVVHLIDFTPDSGGLIDSFCRERIENYLRWFTVFGSFEHVVLQAGPAIPLRLLLQATDDVKPELVSFGHDWPEDDLTKLRELKQRDERRPFNYFRKTFRKKDLTIEGGYKIDIAAVFEGRRGRLERDRCIKRQRVGGLYAEEARYGLWLCRDYVPVEAKFDWLADDDCPRIAADLRRPLMFVNCQNFLLTANRGSVGNSPPDLLEAVRKGIYGFLEEILVEPDLEEFFQEYQEELFSRQRENDKKALTRRINRYNKKKQCTITLSDKKQHVFWEPTREITLFGLITELQAIDPRALGLELLDYDDHSGIDMLVRRNGDPADLLAKDKVAYVELKYELTAQLNHAFDNLHSIICWETILEPNNLVRDVGNNTFTFREDTIDGVTHSQLVPPADSKLSHNIQVLVLRRYLKEKYQLKEKNNPKQIAASSR